MHNPYLPPPRQDECTMAMLAHVMQMFAGIIAPLVLYFLKRHESPFVAFHALQAILWQLVVLAVSFVFWIVMMILFFSSIVTASNSPSPPPAFFVMMISAFVFSILLFGTNLALAIMHGVRAYRGEWSTYPLVGSYARRIVGV
jgi:hypothetical protein